MGDFIHTPVEQQYQTDDQYQDEQFSESINRELDSLLDINTPTDTDPTKHNPTDDSQFKSFIEEQKQQRLYDQQQREQQQQQQQREQRERDLALSREQLKLEAEAKAKQYAPQFDNIVLSEAQRSAYAESEPYIRSLVQDILGDVWANNINPALTDHQQSIMDLAKRPTQVSMSMEQQIALSRPNINSIVNEPEFQRYLAEPVEGTNLTRRDVMNLQYSRSDVGGVVTMIDAYTAARDKSRPTRSLTPSGSAHSAPQGGQGGQQQRKRSYSELSRAQAAHRQGRMTRDKLTEIENHFEILDQRGLVDYNS